jgi:hypothetical protein
MLSPGLLRLEPSEGRGEGLAVASHGDIVTGEGGNGSSEFAAA